MKIEAGRHIQSANEEMVELKITWDPNNPNHDGYAAMIYTVIDTVKRILTLEKALEDYDKVP